MAQVVDEVEDAVVVAEQWTEVTQGHALTHPAHIKGGLGLGGQGDSHNKELDLSPEVVPGPDRASVERDLIQEADQLLDLIPKEQSEAGGDWK